MVPRALCVVFLTCQLVWMCYGSPTYGGGNANGHVGKKGSERRYQDYYDRSRTSKRTCPDSFETKANYIIRTKESLENDATFIDAIKVATSNRCIERCCDAQDVVDDDGDTVTCDAAVFVDGDDAFENKESNCFLFQCRFDTGERFRCKFSDHDSYISGMVGGFGVEPYFADSETEEEEEEEEQIPQTKAVPSTTQGKGNDPKTTEVQEEEECNSNQFQCDNGECIRLTLLCDEYKDCQDNSDESEERCTAINGHVTPTNNGSLWKIWRYMYGSSAQDYTTEYPRVDPDESNNRVEEGGDEKQEEEEDEGNNVDDSDSDVKVPSTDAARVSNQGNGDTTSKPLVAHQSNAPDQGSQDQRNNSATHEAKDVPKTPSSGEHSEVRVVEKQGVTATAVLPLTIGLFLTLFLLLMMSCRLRYMNRRLRYGRLKTNNAHDADYLINGMYL